MDAVRHFAFKGRPSSFWYDQFQVPQVAVGSGFSMFVIVTKKTVTNIGIGFACELLFGFTNLRNYNSKNMKQSQRASKARKFAWNKIQFVLLAAIVQSV